MIRTCLYLCIVSLSIVACSQPEKQPKQIPVADFFKDPEKSAFRVSPDGKYVSFLQPYKNRLNIFIEELANKKITQLTADTIQGIYNCFWGNNNQLLFLRDNKGDENYHLYTVDKHGKSLRDLTPFEKVRVRPINALDKDSDNVLITMNKRLPSISDVYKLNIITGEMKMVQENPGTITRWVLDAKDQIRMAVATDGVNEILLYRDNESQPFRKILTSNFKEHIQPISFTPDNKYVNCVSNIGRDKSAVVLFDPVLVKEIKTIYQNSNYDVTYLAFSNKTQELIYTAFIDWKVRIKFLNDSIEKLFNHIYSQLPGYELNIVDVDKNEERFLVRTYGDRSLGAFYLYDLKADKLVKLSDVSPWLPEKELAEVKPVSYTSRDGLVINGYLTLPKGKAGKNLPVIIYPHPDPFYQRSRWTFNPEVQFFANRGYAVLQINYRGSYGYGRAFREAGFKQFGLKMQDDVTDGAKWLIKEGIADSTRMAIYGSRSGGFFAMNGLVKTPELYRCAVDYSGLINLFTFIKEIPPYYKPFLEMMYEMVGNPEKDVDYFKEVSPVFHTDKINKPLLVAMGKKDPRVNISEVNKLVKDLKKRGLEVNYILKDNEGHGFKNQENKLAFYTEVEQFLAKNLQVK